MSITGNNTKVRTSLVAPNYLDARIAAAAALTAGTRTLDTNALAQPTLAETLARLSPSDIVVVEGYKREPIPKIEVRRLEAAQTDGMASSDPHVIAVAPTTPPTRLGAPLSISTTSRG